MNSTTPLKKKFETKSESLLLQKTSNGTEITVHMVTLGRFMTTILVVDAPGHSAHVEKLDTLLVEDDFLQQNLRESEGIRAEEVDPGYEPPPLISEIYAAPSVASESNAVEKVAENIERASEQVVVSWRSLSPEYSRGVEATCELTGDEFEISAGERALHIFNEGQMIGFIKKLPGEDPGQAFERFVEATGVVDAKLEIATEPKSSLSGVLAKAKKGNYWSQFQEPGRGVR